jgi:hypothetical protein
MWTVGEYDYRRDGWPILKDGIEHLLAVYRGGTEPARQTALQMCAALNPPAAPSEEPKP